MQMIPITRIIAGKTMVHVPVERNDMTAPAKLVPKIFSSLLCVVLFSHGVLYAAQPSVGDPIQWEQMVEGQLDAAFAKAKAEQKPLFLYWGAAWCPPCNQVKATVFNRADFIARTKAFVPVYLDGDQPGAQKLAERFKVRGYPTMVLLKPDGTEITRLPGEVDAQRYMQVLNLGLNGAKPIKQILQTALSAPNALAPSDWQLLAFYAWDVDEAQLLAADQVPKVLAQLAKACPASQAQAQLRLRLRALIATDAKPSNAQVKDRSTLLKTVLSSKTNSRANFDLLSGFSEELLSNAAGINKEDAGVSDLLEPMLQELTALSNDTSLSMNDRINAMVARYTLEAPKDVAPVVVKVKAMVASVNTAQERQSVVPTAAYLLTKLEQLAESDAMLAADLPTAVAPYYHMLSLSANAKQRGDKPAAVNWAKRAWQASKGPATRLQWGSSYVRTMIDLQPQDKERIEEAAQSVIGELVPTADTFYERNIRALKRMAEQLHGWNGAGQHADTLAKLQGQLSSVCRRLPASDPGRLSCEGALAPPKTKTS
jgi:thioredoxin-related protein